MSASSLLTPGSNKINPVYLPASAPADIITSPLIVNAVDDSENLTVNVNPGVGGNAEVQFQSSNNTFEIDLGVGNSTQIVQLSISNDGTGVATITNNYGELAVKTTYNSDDIDLVPGSGKVYVWKNGEDKVDGGVLSCSELNGFNVECQNGVTISVNTESIISANADSSITLGTGTNTVGISSGGVVFDFGTSSTVALDNGGNITCNKTIVDAVQLGTKCELTYGPAITNPSLTQVELINTDGVFVVSNKVSNGIVYDTQFHPIFRGKGQGTLATTGIPQAVISCPGITSTDVVLLTPVWDGITPKGMIQVGGVTPSAGTFDVISSDNTDNDANFMWAVIIA